MLLPRLIILRPRTFSLEDAVRGDGALARCHAAGTPQVSPNTGTLCGLSP